MKTESQTLISSRGNSARPHDAMGESKDIPLVVDVDGALLSNDLFLESTVCLLATHPIEAAKTPLWLSGGTARLKTEIADRVVIDANLLPFDPTVLAFMQGEKERGRRVFLASESDRRFVAAIARHLGFIDGIFATDRTMNLSGIHKRDALVQAFSEKGFDYIGASQEDPLIWKAARLGYVVKRGLLNPLHFGLGEVEPPILLVRRSVKLHQLVKALRLHQWAKNLLLFVPLVLGGASGNPVAVIKTLVCFLAFGVVASSTYLINDLLDLTSDRLHPRKRLRPVANGEVPIKTACLLTALGLGLGLGAGLLIGFPVFLALLVYLAATLAYAFVFKIKPIIDVVLLAGLYTWRLFVGVLVANVVLSPWLMVFSFAFFLSLSLTKRHVEISDMTERGKTVLPGRGYQSVDGPFVLSMGVAAGVSSILIFCLYLIEGAFRAASFSRPEILWACPVILLMWLCRVWLLSARGLLHEDPVVFAVVDRKSLILGGVAALAVLAAIVG